MSNRPITSAAGQTFRPLRRASGQKQQTAPLMSVGSDIRLAIVLTLIGGAIAYLLAGGVPLIGIDDAAITRSYAQNVARGAGYVYNVGGERVEGSTAFLWVGALSALYALTPAPELAILALCASLTSLAVLAALRLTGWLTQWCGGDIAIARRVLIAALLASPGYFLWSVWTMMELALWSAAILGLVLCLARVIEGCAVPGVRAFAIVLALALPLIRPEGIAVGFGLGIIALCLSPRTWRTALTVAIAATASCAALTAFRLSYFGQPFPNTFYAKVSSDLIDGLKAGLHYLASFILGAPFVDALTVLVVVMAVVAVIRLRDGLPGGRALLLVLLTVLGAFAVYAGLGGDHFVLWRFYQPVVPLMLVVLAVAVGLTIPRLAAYRTTAAFTGASLVAIAAGCVHYVQARFDVQSEFALVQSGTAFGTYLNTATPRPVIGIGPAGGIALTYDGQIRDLLGLNWVEMAHANPIKVGMRNHASFDLETFWRYPPEVVATFNRSCARAAPDAGFDGIFQTARFRAAYVPVQFSDGSDCWPGYATADWISEANLPGLSVLDWSAIPRSGG